MKIIPVIMSGGSGTRLWPLSTPERPKQFHKLLGDDVMLVETAKRFAQDVGEIAYLPPVVIAGERHGALVAQALEDAGIRPSKVILEPEGRNTAAAAAAGALAAQAIDGDAMVLLCPADHLVRDPVAFHATIAAASGVAVERIVTFGMTTSGPETGFGYIKQGEALAPGVFEILAFKEKPTLEVAQAYLAEGGYSWNSGMFFFSPSTMLDEIAALQPDILAGVRKAIADGRETSGGLVLEPKAFGAIKSLPVDVAVMERTSRGAVVPCSIGWADVGSWSEYWRLSPRDADGNALEGSVLARGVTNSLVRAEDGVHVTVAGVDNVVVVVSQGNVMVMPMDQAQTVKALIPAD